MEGVGHKVVSKKMLKIFLAPFLLVIGLLTFRS